jgi:hypothetical protein
MHDMQCDATDATWRSLLFFLLRFVLPSPNIRTIMLLLVWILTSLVGEFLLFKFLWFSVQPTQPGQLNVFVPPRRLVSSQDWFDGLFFDR